MIKQATIFILVVTISSRTLKKHVCEHDKVQNEENIKLTKFHHNGFVKLTPFDRLMQSSGTYTVKNMRILADYTNITDPNLQASIAAIYNYTLNKIMSIFSVNTTNLMPVVKNAGCNSTVVWQPQFLNGSQPYDFIIFVRTFNDTTSNAVASAKYCSVDPNTNRPILGVMNINLAYWKLVGEDDIDATSEVMNHETFHAMGFSGSMLSYLPNPISINMTYYTKSGTYQNTTTIVSPTVKAYAVKQFNCSSAVGLQFENEGGSGTAGSHWEKTVMGFDMMTGVQNYKMMISVATLGFFQDTGFYIVDMTQAEDTPWGLNEGCGFLNSNCSTSYREFAPSSNWTCSSDYLLKLQGSKGSLSDTCYQYEIYQGRNCPVGQTVKATLWGESGGPTSRCFNGFIKSNGAPFSYPGCFKSSCAPNNTITFQMDGQSFQCTTANQNIVYSYKKQYTSSNGTVLNGTFSQNVTCPDPVDFCKKLTTTGCPNDCSGRGRCLTNGKCRCFLFYSGDTCQNVNTCTFGSQICGLQGVNGGAMSEDITTGGYAGILQQWTVAVLLVLMIAKLG